MVEIKKIVMAQTKKSKRIAYLKAKLRSLESKYEDTKEISIRDSIIRVRRELLQLSGVDLSADLTTAMINKYKRSREGNDKVVKKF